jgi:hypothetical protein
MKKNIFEIWDHQVAAETFYRDVGSNNITTYDVSTFNAKATLINCPVELTDKWAGVTVAVSGSAAERTDWMLLMPYRVDVSGSKSQPYQEKVYDRDPIIIALDSDTGKPHEVALLAQHQSFQDRTTHVPGFVSMSYADTVTTLRSQLVTGSVPYVSGSTDLHAAMNHMVDLLRKSTTGSV